MCWLGRYEGCCFAQEMLSSPCRVCTRPRCQSGHPSCWHKDRFNTPHKQVLAHSGQAAAVTGPSPKAFMAAQVDARVLNPPQLFYKDRGNKPMAMRVSNGAWNLRDVRLHRGRPLTSFAIISFDNPRFVSRQDPEGLEVKPPL